MSLKLLIIDYGAGNVASVANAIENLEESSVEIKISSKTSDVLAADRIILPGVGAFGDCMKNLELHQNFLEELLQQVLIRKKPLLAICVGMQVLASAGHEDGFHRGLDIIPGEVKKINNPELPVPHMGWNQVFFNPNPSLDLGQNITNSREFDGTCFDNEIRPERNSHPLFVDIKNGEHFYFANSYQFICTRSEDAICYTNYGTKMIAAVAKENVIGVQFHPEKSGKSGITLLRNFINWQR